MPKLFWTPAALLRLEEILDHIAAESGRDAAASVGKSILDAVRRLESFPESAPVFVAPLRRLSIPGLPFSCFYEYADELVSIIRVRHDRQKPLQ